MNFLPFSFLLGFDTVNNLCDVDKFNISFDQIPRDSRSTLVFGVSQKKKVWIRPYRISFNFLIIDFLSTNASKHCISSVDHSLIEVQGSK